jgi:hypothetical protein
VTDDYPMGDRALELAELGYYVFPLHTPGEGGICSCLDRACASVGKHPRVQKGFLAATVSADQIRAWWGMWPQANIAIRTGSLSRCWVLDVDPAHGGDASLVDLRLVLPEIETTRCAWTGGGGLHYYFAWPAEGSVRNHQARWPGIDIRGEGGYVVAPPSLHRTGLRYEWLNG